MRCFPYFLFSIRSRINEQPDNRKATLYYNFYFMYLFGVVVVVFFFNKGFCLFLLYFHSLIQHLSPLLKNALTMHTVDTQTLLINSRTKKSKRFSFSFLSSSLFSLLVQFNLIIIIVNLCAYTALVWYCFIKSRFGRCFLFVVVVVISINTFSQFA